MHRLRILNNGSGFSMVEVMVVVLILGVIVAIAVPSWIGARERSQVKCCMAQLREIKYAKDTWAIENNKRSTDAPEWANLLVYLKKTPVCPSGGEYDLGIVSEEPTCSIGGDHKLY